MEKAVVRAQKDLLKHLETEYGDADNSWKGASVKGGQSGAGSLTRVHARLVHLPPSRFKSTLSQLKARDVGQMWQVSGTVVRASPIQMYESARTYQCKATKNGGCGRTFLVPANVQQYNNALTPPEACPLLLDNKKPCRGTNLVAMDPTRGSVHTDYQEIKIQESSPSTGSKVGHIPRSLLVKLQHDLVDLCQPGEKVVIVGSLLAQWQSDLVVNTKTVEKNTRDAAEPDIGLALLAHSILVLSDERMSMDTKSNTGLMTLDENKRYSAEFERYWQAEAHRPIQARDYICQAVCPKLYGLQVIKLGLLLTLIGGVSAESCTEMNNEGDNGNSGDSNNDMTSVAQEDETEPCTIHDGSDLFTIPQCRESRKLSQEPLGSNPFGDRQENRQRANNRKSQKIQSSNHQMSEMSVEADDSNCFHFSHHSNQSSSAQVYTRRRSQSHMLLVGDPGTGKSQFLRFAAALSPRAVLTTGVGTTSAGLTCAADRHGTSGEFALEAGALVLADQGVCCIDEFGCIRDQDRTTIHEAMEQQHLSVAKAGIVCKLNSRATIIAVMNPRDCLYDNQCSLAVNTGLGTPLLSRFDLIFKLVDSSDATRDDNITTYLLTQAIQGPRCGEDGNDTTNAFMPETWPLEKLRAYIAIVKEKICPVLSDEAALLLERHYEACRASKSRTMPVTVRFLESLIRLSQAHARLLYRSNISLLDAVAVIRVMECSASCYGGFDCPSSYDHDGQGNMESLYCDPMCVDFVDQADLDLCCFEFTVLKRYGMLEYMAENRRREAEEAVQCKTGQSWAEVEGYYSMESTSISQSSQFGLQSLPYDTMNSNGSQKPQQSRPNITEVQDHYGRTHYSQAPQESHAQQQNKRRRQH